MAFDAYYLKFVLDEVRAQLLGARVEKIHQPSRDTVILLLRCEGGRKKLLFAANPTAPRLHLTAASPENPPEPPMFCMLLRKHVGGGTICDVKQQPFERVVELTVENKNELGYRQLKRLVFEVTGKSANIILTDENYTITDSLKRPDAELTSKKLLVKGAKYRFFEKTKK